MNFLLSLIELVGSVIPLWTNYIIFIFALAFLASSFNIVRRICGRV